MHHHSQALEHGLRPQFSEVWKMTEVDVKPKTDVAAIRNDVEGIIRHRGLTQAAVSRESGVSSSALSRFLAGNYQGDNEAVAAKLLAWKEGVSKKDSIPARLIQGHGFVRTTAAAKITNGLDYAQLAADLVVVIGAPGVGKTETLENFRREGSNVWLATMSPDTSGKVPMLQELGFAFGLDLTGGAAGMRRQIAARVRNTGGLIVVDEAQHLDGKALETLRTIHDTTKIGMVLCGNPKLLTNMAALPQAYSRVGCCVSLGKPSTSDVRALAERFDVTGGDELDFLSGLAQHPGGLRCVVKTLRLGMMHASGEGVAVAVEHLAAAWSELALEGQA
jgi:DNA transposition AAA+ family ATPase